MIKIPNTLHNLLKQLSSERIEINIETLDGKSVKGKITNARLDFIILTSDSQDVIIAKDKIVSIKPTRGL